MLLNLCPPECQSQGRREVPPPLRELRGKALLHFLLVKSTASSYLPNAFQQPLVRKFAPLLMLYFSQAVRGWEAGLWETYAMGRSLPTGGSESLESPGFKERGLLR